MPAQNEQTAAARAALQGLADNLSAAEETRTEASDSLYSAASSLDEAWSSADSAYDCASEAEDEALEARDKAQEAMSRAISARGEVEEAQSALSAAREYLDSLTSWQISFRVRIQQALTALDALAAPEAHPLADTATAHLRAIAALIRQAEQLGLPMSGEAGSVPAEYEPGEGYEPDDDDHPF